MPKSVTIDELHLTLRVPNDLSDEKTETVREVLTGDDFMSRLRRAVRDIVRRTPELSAVRVSLSR